MDSPVAPVNEHALAFAPLDILVVDDDHSVRILVACILRHANHRVVCASDGQEAWEALCTGNYDGMITDNDMPRLSGVDLVRKLRALPSSLPVILISGRMSWNEEALSAFLQPGLVMEKPFTCSELLLEVSRVFGKTIGNKFVQRINANTSVQTTISNGPDFAQPILTHQ